jgi:hypothetical protein
MSDYATTHRLTPYDTGDRLEPHEWVKGQVATPSGLPRQAMPDDFGRVDFDDDESNTLMTVFAEPDGKGGVRLIVFGNVPITVERVDGSEVIEIAD